MKKAILSWLVAAGVLSGINAQVVTTNPGLPVHNQPVTILFHADQGNKGLMNYSGTDVYAHTGVITDKSVNSSDWKYVKAAWTANLPACKLTKLSANEYQLQISPGIREFYGVPANEKILKMTFVFRNSSASNIGRDAGDADVFVTVYEEGLNLSFLKPADRISLVSEGDVVPVEISATSADSIYLLLDNTLVHQSATLTFDTSFIATGTSRHMLVARAKKDNSWISDTAWYLAKSNTLNRPLPLNVRQGLTYHNDSVTFVLFAPGKQFVYLIGDFNDWLPDSLYQLKNDGDSYWITIGGLTTGREYAFQYLVDGTFRIADPYSEKILDPDNDKYIPDAVYPNLLAYPAGKTNDIAGVIQTGQIPFSWEAGYIPPAAEKLIIYELLVRDFVVSHDIKEVGTKLDYLQTLGINAIELMPFSEFEGNSSWGYNPSFYFATDKYYGRDTDFKEFIQECHSRGIAVIMDMVLNHAYGQNPMVRMYFDAASGKPSPENPWFNVNSPNTSFSWGYDFNHESSATQYFVDRVVEYWLTEYNLDGFRFDFTKGFTNTPGDGSGYDASRIAILKRVYDKMQEVKPDAYMICEHFAANAEEKELSDYGLLLWGNSNYNYNEATMGYLNNSDFSWASYRSRGWNNPALVSYMESHDEERLMYKNITYGSISGNYNVKDPATALKRMELAGVFFFTIPGPKMIWQFGELGYDVTIDYNGRVGEKPVRWEYLGEPDRLQLYLTWAKLLDIRKKYQVFGTNDYTMTVGANVADKKIVLRHDEENAIVVGNFGLVPISTIPGYTNTGWWYELFSGDSVNITDVNAAISLNPGEYRIYTSKKMESVISGTGGIKNRQYAIYPNPVTDRIYFDFKDITGIITIYDLSGNKIVTAVSDRQRSMDVSDLPPGMYFISYFSDDAMITEKFVKR